MAASLIDSTLFSPMFGDDAMAVVWSEDSQLSTWLAFEAALARAEAKYRVIPQAAADAITGAARLERLDKDLLAQEMRRTSHVMVPFIRQLAAACEGESGEFVHWGATTQDVMDTGQILQIRESEAMISSSLDSIVELLTDLAVRHRSTLMPGRTHAQHAVPITFGYKVAIWIDELRRHQRTLAAMRSELLVGQLGGAAGTLSSLGVVGLDVRDEMMRDLGLGVADITWHASRDRLSHFAFVMAAIGATMRRAAQEVVNLQRPEIGEVEEAFEAGKVGSSTMPHKRNPALAQVVCTLGVLLQENLSLAMHGLVQNHERDMSVLQSEWQWLPHMCIQVNRSLKASRDLFGNLVVNADRMTQNLDLTAGLIYSEAAMMKLAEVTGRQTAHEVIYDAARRVYKNGSSLGDELSKDERIVELGIDMDALGVTSGPQTVEVAEHFVDVVCNGISSATR